MRGPKITATVPIFRGLAVLGMSGMMETWSPSG